MCELGDAPSADRIKDDVDRSEEVPAEQPEGGIGHAAEVSGASTACNTGWPQQALGRPPTGSGSHAAAAGQQEVPGPASGGDVRVVQRRSIDNPLLAGSGALCSLCTLCCVVLCYLATSPPGMERLPRWQAC